MPATTIKLPSELRDRIAELARNAGTSVHAFMLQAIAEKAELAEKRGAFVQSALEAEQEFEESGLAYDAQDVHRYLRARAAGKRAARPKPKAWRK